MRKITVIFSVLVLCSVSAFAQKTISKDDFEHLVDYANCQYLMAFIEKNASKSYIKDTYEKKVKPILQKATLDDLTKVPTIDTINNLFSIDSIDSIDSNDKALSNLLKSAKGLAETINKRKGNYDYSPDNNSLVDELNAKIWSNVDLKNTATKIKNDVRKKYQLGSIKETSSTPCFLIFISFVVGILFGLVLKSLICKFVKQIYRGLKEGRGSSGKKEENNGGANNGNNTTKNDLVDELKADIERKDKEIKALTKQKVCLETKLTQKNKKIKEMNGKQTIPHQQAPQQTNNAPQQANNNPPQDSSLYFASKYDKTLKEPLTSSLDANFRVYDVNENEGKFECIGQVGNPNWFERICEIDTTNGIGNTQIITTQAGKVRKEGNNWVVITPAKIKFE